LHDSPSRAESEVISHVVFRPALAFFSFSVIRALDMRVRSGPFSLLRCVITESAWHDIVAGECQVRQVPALTTHLERRARILVTIRGNRAKAGVFAPPIAAVALIDALLEQRSPPVSAALSVLLDFVVLHDELASYVRHATDDDVLTAKQREAAKTAVDVNERVLSRCGAVAAQIESASLSFWGTETVPASDGTPQLRADPDVSLAVQDMDMIGLSQLIIDSAASVQHALAPFEPLDMFPVRPHNDDDAT
jgi:hypothetical protein